VINVTSGAELPERCRELALHFENQGTPIMIGQFSFIFTCRVFMGFSKEKMMLLISTAHCHVSIITC
jgi:hypothetical protein